MSDDLESFARELTSAAAGIDPRKLVQVEAMNVKKDWAAAWGDIKGMPHIGRSVTFDTQDHVWGAKAEIGPALGGQGSLGGIVEDGTSVNGPIRPVIDRLVQDAGDRLENYLADQVQDLL